MVPTALPAVHSQSDGVGIAKQAAAVRREAPVKKIKSYAAHVERKKNRNVILSHGSR